MLNQQKKICVITGSRAEYGLLRWLLEEIKLDDQLELQIVVTGAHLSHEFGMTINEIIDDGFYVNYKVEMLLSDDSSAGVTKSLGLGVIGFADAFKQLMPDMIVLLGDRYEIFAAAQAGLIARIPLAHIHGGERSEGAFDESIRHAITKLSHFHFVAGEEFARRVQQLGESTKNIFLFGAPGLDYLDRVELMSKNDIFYELSLNPNYGTMVITFHNETLREGGPVNEYEELFSALDKYKKYNIVFTLSNADTDGRIISSLIHEYAVRSEHNVKVVTSLGIYKYLSLIKYSDVVVGNSSSGLIEVPYLNVPTVNIGNRQQGRPRASTVIDCTVDSSSIYNALKNALADSFKTSCQNVSSPWIKNNASLQIKNKIKELVTNSNVTSTKVFKDIAHV